MKLNVKECDGFHLTALQAAPVCQADARPSEKTPVRAGVVFLTVIDMVAWGKRHFLPMDQLARKKAVRRFFTSDRGMVCSDSTMARRLRGMDVEPLRQLILTRASRRVQRHGNLGRAFLKHSGLF